MQELFYRFERKTTKMAAPKGNNYWELRSKHGRDKLFASPQLLWEAAVEYFKFVDENPEYETDFRGKDADEVHIPKRQPYTLHDLCLYLDVNTAYFRQFKQLLDGKTDDLSKDFSTLITRIEEVIYAQKYRGAASGFFNPNIIARDLGLADKQEIKADVKTDSLDYSKLSDETLNDIANAANSDQG
jgi:hypothetical protein